MQPFSPSQFVAAYIFPINPLIASTTDSAPLPAEPAVGSPSSTAAGGSGTGNSRDGDDATAAQPRGGGKGRLGEDAGSRNAMLASWLAKSAFVTFLVWLPQYKLPGLLESFAYGTPGKAPASTNNHSSAVPLAADAPLPPQT